MNTLEKLLKEKQHREDFELRVIAALNLRYERTDISTVVARESATAGHVQSYLAAALKEVNSSKFRARIRDILVSREIVVPVYSEGIVWWKGLGPLKEDVEKAHAVIAQNRKDRDNYRIRQREFANRRKQLPTATKTDPVPVVK